MAKMQQPKKWNWLLWIWCLSAVCVPILVSLYFYPFFYIFSCTVGVKKYVNFKLYFFSVVWVADGKIVIAHFVISKTTMTLLFALTLLFAHLIKFWLLGAKVFLMHIFLSFFTSISLIFKDLFPPFLSIFLWLKPRLYRFFFLRAVCLNSECC